MHDSASPWPRRTRGLTAGLLCAFGTTWSHTALSGHGFGPTTLAVALGCVAACLGLARRPVIGLPLLLTVCLAGQGVAHVAMSLAPGTGMSGMSDAHHDAGLGVGGLACSTPSVRRSSRPSTTRS